MLKREIVIRLQLPAELKRRYLVAIALAIVAVSVVAYAAPLSLHMFQSGETLSAATLNKNFADLEDALYARGVPPGTIAAFAGPTVPAGWLPCDGSAISRSTYSDLFAAITISFGGGDGVNTFNLPDLRGRMALGAGTGASLTPRTLGQALGEEAHQLTVAELPSHAHTVTDPGHTHSIYGYAQALNSQSGSFGTLGDWVSHGATGSSKTGISIDSTGGGAPHNNMPPALVLNYIIKY